MENTRLFLVIALSFISLMLWDAWQRDYHAPPTTESPQATITEAPDIEMQAPVSVEKPVESPLSFASAAAPIDKISVTTDLFEIDVNLLGGGIVKAALREYPIDVEDPDRPFLLLAQTADRFFIHQGGLKGSGDPPSHRSPFTAAATDYRLADGKDTLTVDLNWRSAAGLAVTKRFTFTRGSYVIDIDYLIDNATPQEWSGRAYEQLQRAKPGSKKGVVRTFTGPALSTPEKRYQKFDYDDLVDQPINLEVKDGWVGILEHYFVSALLPPSENLSHFYSLILDGSRYAVGYWGPTLNVPTGGSGRIRSAIFIGPKLHDVLLDTAPGLELTVDFGVLWFIAKPVFLTLRFIADITGNWGWAIIIITVMLKLLFYPLSAAGYRSMAKMRKVQPRMMAVKERYGGDKTRMNQAMMELYKEEKINPLGGCLPILVQIPVFISLYWVLLESVELRQAPFGLWLTDLSTKDPLYILPLIMGVSMWFQQKLNPAPMDPVQQKVMQILPIAFTFFFMFFPCGLVLYWVVNNILSIAQQWTITRSIENAPST
jgi:YidC/Oxa1 family membrane protein insertase